ncbi:PAS domain S-box-containing protein [Catalinimonas alkaloidigena]|uniref:histidine kinase n=1 Tax=Catalinimonas alkaloidigena TaxID=1075417 RepID=A0A1G9N427_9BACT|nr:PAS domain-containing sensor histidine kinase [Catalinimonas alkaloidigena]SDL81269.1 PAS domain S-box-containing protein [Catalinimonas alkaloidigena]
MELEPELLTPAVKNISREFAKQYQVEQINQVLLHLAEGNFRHIAPVSNRFDEIDAIASGINMLSEELQATTISKNYLDSVLRSIVDMLFIFDDSFVIQQVTPKACELLKCSEPDLIGQPINVLFDGRKARFVHRLKTLIQSKEALQDIETSFKLLSKENLPVTLSLFVLKNNQQEPTGYLMIAEDLKEKLLTTSALNQRNEELQTLIYRTSHDLKGPLASMLGLFQIVEKETDNLTNLQYYLSLIKKSAEKLNNTLSGLLEIGMTSQAELSLQTFNLSALVQEVTSALETYPGREEVTLNLQIDDKLVLTSNEKLVRSVLQNLVENSIKYRQYRGCCRTLIYVSARQQKGAVVITVKDNGQGMDKHLLKRAFDMFYRGNQDSNGSGLGLFIVKTSVEKLGGQLKVKSKVRQGTEMKIVLPHR